MSIHIKFTNICLFNSLFDVFNSWICIVNLWMFDCLICFWMFVFVFEWLKFDMLCFELLNCLICWCVFEFVIVWVWCVLFCLLMLFLICWFVFDVCCCCLCLIFRIRFIELLKFKKSKTLSNNFKIKTKQQEFDSSKTNQKTDKTSK